MDSKLIIGLVALILVGAVIYLVMFPSVGGGGGGTMPNMMCDTTDDCQGYCLDSIEIIENYGVAPPQGNEPQYLPMSAHCSSWEIFELPSGDTLADVGYSSYGVCQCLIA
jgi:hypothetical protein